MWRSAPSLVLVSALFWAPGAKAATFYVRPDGGSAERCDGKSDAAAPTTGTAQPCAWNHPFWALPPAGTPRISGGDTLIISAGSYMMGFGAPGAVNCESEGRWECHMPPIPSGPSPSQPTRILGAGWNAGCPSPPELWGTERANMVVNLEGGNNVEIGCLSITDHSTCVEFHSGSIPCQRDTPPYGPWAADGLHASDSKNVRLFDLDIHGFAAAGVRAGRLTDWTLERVRIAGNGAVGWDGDIDGSDSNSGTLTFRRVTIEWNGCGETYPGGQPTGCWAQSAGGYGDGLGTGETGGNWVFEDSAFLHNTSDGLDLLYARTGSTITITRTRAEGNAGNQLKTNGPALVENSIVVGDCAFFEGKPFTFNVDPCRALGNSLSLSLRPSDLVRIINNTITGQGDCLVIAGCFGGGPCNGTEKVRLRNNIFIGNVEFLSSDDRTCLMYQEGFPQGDSLFDADYHFVSGVKDDACPGQHTVCNVDPGLVSSSLATFDAHLVSTSPVIGFAAKTDAPALDFDSFPRDAAPDLGAYEYHPGGGTCTLTCTHTVPTTAIAGAPVEFSGTVQASGCAGPPVYDWDFGDGTPHGSGNTVSHAYTAAGVRNWRLLVTVPGASCSRTGTIQVSESTLRPYLIPAVAHSPGAEGSLWRSDLTVVNQAPAEAKLTFALVPPSGPARAAEATVVARGTREWIDVATSLFALDPEATISGALHVTSDRPLTVTSRTYDQGGKGTFGGGLSAVTPSSALSAGVTGVLPQLKKSSQYRTNAGFANLMSESITVELRLFDESGQALGKEVSVNLPPRGFIQVTDIFSAAGAGDSRLAYATVEVKTPGGKAGIYASVIDNDSNDPTIVPLSLP